MPETTPRIFTGQPNGPWQRKNLEEENFGMLGYVASATWIVKIVKSKRPLLAVSNPWAGKLAIDC